MNEQVRFVVELPVWMITIVVALTVIDLGLQIRTAYWEHQARKAAEAVSDYRDPMSHG